MQNRTMTELEKAISRMQALRDDVRANMHHAGLEELVEWQKLEPETVDVELYSSRPDELRARVERLLDRLSKLRTSLSLNELAM
ncbi:hypothetical protein [Pendulispora albinea]|uniref:Uncharacterized protein n=1 Tax=Pendulispora albinea TaxID=2741071 RepID=A0ABZ2M1D1_9BACT